MRKQNTTKRIRLSLQEKTVEDLEILGNMKNVLVDALLTELFSKMDSLTIYKWLILKQRKKENLQEALNKLFTIIFSSSFASITSSAPNLQFIEPPKEAPFFNTSKEKLVHEVNTGGMGKESIKKEQPKAVLASEFEDFLL